MRRWYETWSSHLCAAWGRQLLFVTFESEDPAHTWLNAVICVGEGRIDPGTLEARIEISACEPST